MDADTNTLGIFKPSPVLEETWRAGFEAGKREGILEEKAKAKKVIDKLHRILSTVRHEVRWENIKDSE